MPDLAPTSISRPRSADLIPGYRLMEIVGKGGMGEVHKAQQLSLGRSVAIKLLASNLAGDPGFVARFEKEAAALATLSHPHIVAIVDKGKAADTYFLVMEFVAGPSLRELMRAPEFDVATALKIIVEMCRGIDYAHGRGVVHRDLKPENILIDEQAGRIAKVSDFGLAAFLDGEARPRFDVTATHVAMGTAAYMAPEQRVDAKNADHRADIYAMGVMLYEVLTGELPIGSYAEASTKRAGLDKRIDAIIDRCLKTNPADRYGRTADLLADLEPLAPTAGFTQPPKPLSPVERAVAVAKQTARTAGRFAAMGLVLISMGIIGLTVVRNMVHVGPAPWPGEALAGDLAHLNSFTLAGRVEDHPLSRVTKVAIGPDTLSVLDDGRPVTVEPGALLFEHPDSKAPVGRATFDLTEVEADSCHWNSRLLAETPSSDWKGTFRRALFGLSPDPRGALLLVGTAGRYVALVIGSPGTPVWLEWALGERRGAMVGLPSPEGPTKLELGIDSQGDLTAFVGEGVDKRPVGEPVRLGKEWRKVFGGLPKPAIGCIDGNCRFEESRFTTEREPPPPPIVVQNIPPPVLDEHEEANKGKVASAETHNKNSHTGTTSSKKEQHPTSKHTTRTESDHHVSGTAKKHPK
jgi:hypothetical protein